MNKENIQNYPTYIPQFRGRSKSGKWYYGFYSGHAADYDYSFLNTETNSHLPVESKTISISTGFKDANDIMIYDGDIIEFGTQKRHYLVYWNSEAMWWDTELISGNAMQRSEWRCSEYCRLGWLAVELPILGECSTKVIGNRWDNPELLPPAPKWDSNPWGDDF